MYSNYARTISSVTLAVLVTACVSASSPSWRNDAQIDATAHEDLVSSVIDSSGRTYQLFNTFHFPNDGGDGSSSSQLRMVDASGEELWQLPIGEVIVPNMGRNFEYNSVIKGNRGVLLFSSVAPKIAYFDLNGTLLWEKSVAESEGVSVSVDADGNFLVLADATTLGDAASSIMVIDENGETTLSFKIKNRYALYWVNPLLRNKEGNLVLLHKQLSGDLVDYLEYDPNGNLLSSQTLPAYGGRILSADNQSFLLSTEAGLIQYSTSKAEKLREFGAPSQISYCSNMVNNEFFCTAHKDIASYDLAMYYFSSDIASEPTASDIKAFGYINQLYLTARHSAIISQEVGPDNNNGGQYYNLLQIFSASGVKLQPAITLKPGVIVYRNCDCDPWTPVAADFAGQISSNANNLIISGWRGTRVMGRPFVESFVLK